MTLLSIHGLKQQLFQLFVKDFHKNSVSVLVFYYRSSNFNIVFLKLSFHFIGYLSTLLFLHIASNTNTTSLNFRPQGSSDLVF